MGGVNAKADFEAVDIDDCDRVIAQLQDITDCQFQLSKSLWQRETSVLCSWECLRAFP